MHPAYFDIRFRTPDPEGAWPESFVILTAYATTGETWTEAENRSADRRLEELLRSRVGSEPADGWGGPRRVTGFAPDTGHAEPGWAAALPFQEACDLGERFLQDALYVVEGDALYVSYCDERRGLVRVGSFRERLEGEPAR